MYPPSSSPLVAYIPSPCSFPQDLNLAGRAVEENLAEAWTEEMGIDLQQLVTKVSLKRETDKAEAERKAQKAAEAAMSSKELTTKLAEAEKAAALIKTALDATPEGDERTQRQDMYDALQADCTRMRRAMVVATLRELDETAVEAETETAEAKQIFDKTPVRPVRPSVPFNNGTTV